MLIYICRWSCGLLESKKKRTFVTLAKKNSTNSYENCERKVFCKELGVSKPIHAWLTEYKFQVQCSHPKKR